MITHRTERKGRLTLSECRLISNTEKAMLRMIERGVDNVITDDPALLMRVIRERRALSPSELLGLRLRVLDPAAVTTP